jgi:proteasome accessory factor A
MGHLELCLPEVISARQHVAAWHALLRIAEAARQRANRKLPDGERVELLANSSDGRGHSYGGHLDLLVSRRCFDDLFYRRAHHLSFLASFLATVLPLTGAGKLGAEAGPSVPFQISQRADFFTSMVGYQTTHERPLVNARDESHAGSHQARLHVIFLDTTLCHVSCLLRIGLLQIVAAMLEQGEVDLSLLLHDPVRAARVVSRDLTLRAKLRLLHGRPLSALEHQRKVLDRAVRFAARGKLSGIVPGAEEILSTWDETLTGLEQDPLTQAGRLDWVLKKLVLDDARVERHLEEGGGELAHLDQAFHSLDRNEGPFWTCLEAGLVDRVVSDREIAQLECEPPEETRAFARAHLLRRAGSSLRGGSWSEIRLVGFDSSGETVISLEDPLRFGRSETGAILGSGTSFAEAVQTLVIQDDQDRRMPA